MKLHNPHAAAQSRSHSLLLAVDPSAIGTCSAPYAILSAWCGQVGNG